MIKSTDTGTAWMWENVCRIAGSALLERFPAGVCLKVKMEVEDSLSSKQSWLQQAKRHSKPVGLKLKWGRTEARREHAGLT